MAALNVERTKQCLEAFDFTRLFTEELGWSHPPSRNQVAFTAKSEQYKATPVAEIGGVQALIIERADVPTQTSRKQIHAALRPIIAEHVLIFVDPERTRSCWSWVKIEDKKQHIREHFFFKGQAGDAFISKIANLTVDLSELDHDGKLKLVQAAKKVKDALDVQPLVKKFFTKYQAVKDDFVLAIEGIEDQHDRAWYASVLLNRLMFIYFLQKGRFLDGGNVKYLEEKRDDSDGDFFSRFLQALFFDAFAKPEGDRKVETRKLCGKIPYLNGGLFIPHRLEEKYADIRVSNAALGKVLDLLGGFSWTFNDVPGEPEEINPDVLGYIFEKYINQKEFGAYYTPTEITDYLCQQTIERLVLDKMKIATNKSYESVGEMLLRLDAKGVAHLLREVLPSISLLDPACGSGAFLFAALKDMMAIYTAAIGKIDSFNDTTLNNWKKQEFAEHRSVNYWLKKKIITDNLYGVDIMEEACEIAKLRLFMALVSSAKPGDELEPLPNIDFNILPGNSLIGLMRVKDEAFNKYLLKTSSLFGSVDDYAKLVHEKHILTARYRHPKHGDDIADIRKQIDTLDNEAKPILAEMLLAAFKNQNVKYEEATWDVAKGKPGKTKKRNVSLEDVMALEPFHWGYEFSKRFNEGNGFDAIITNPPWEILKPNDKEFFLSVGLPVSRNTMTIKEFEVVRNTALRNDVQLLPKYEEYLSKFPYLSAYFRSAPEFDDQSSIVSGKRTGTDINSYKLFTERCFELLRPGGLCGIIVPTSLYSDLGSKGLREMLFERSCITGIVSLSNERFLFEGVDHRFRFCLLSFQKSSTTETFPFVFRHDPREAISRDALASFLASSDNRVMLSVPTIRRMSPEALSVMQVRSELDLSIMEKMVRFPALGSFEDDGWRLKLCNEFHMTGDSALFRTTRAKGRLPLFEGKCFGQFDHRLGSPKYWVDEVEARSVLEAQRRKRVPKELDVEGGGHLRFDYEFVRLAFRDVASSTNERTVIATVLPPRVFCPHTVSLEQRFVDLVEAKSVQFNSESLDDLDRLYLAAILNSFVFDCHMRRSVGQHVSFFLMANAPAPRLPRSDSRFAYVTLRAAKLVCTAPEFDDLARRAGLVSHKEGITNPIARERIRAELDGLIAHLYGLSEVEFQHILTTFPQVGQTFKNSAMAEFLKIKPTKPDAVADAIRRLIEQDECDSVEFKGSLFTALDFDHEFWETKGLKLEQIQQKLKEEEAAVTHSALKTACAFINTDGGDLMLGVQDETKEILGLESDFQRDKKKPNADGFELKLRQLLDSRLDPTPHGLVKIAFALLEGKTICHLRVSPSPDPHHLDKEEVYIRDGNRTVQLKGVELTNWLKKRVGK